MNSIKLFDDVIKDNLTVNTKFLFKRKSYISRFIKLGKRLSTQSKVRDDLQNKRKISLFRQ